MEIHGFKSLKSDMTDAAGNNFEVGKTYTAKDNDGYYFCERLEDSLRTDIEGEKVIAVVTSLGNVHNEDDEIYEFFNTYTTDKIRIDKVLSRQEIIDYILGTHNEYRVGRFLTYFKLTYEEREYFKAFYGDNENIINAILYYQEGQEDIYKKSLEEQMVIKYE